MDLSTTWLGFDLPNPFVAGASPLCDDLDTVRRLEDAGISALVLRSLFEEQLTAGGKDGAGVPSANQVRPDWFWFDADTYLDLLRRTVDAVDVPVVASINGSTVGGWLEYAVAVESAGASALELNLYDVIADPEMTGSEVDRQAVAVVSELRRHVKLPLNVKLSPFYSSLPNLCRRLVDAGADGVTLFNRFYQPDIDIDAREVVRRLELSGASDLLVRLNWLAILAPQIKTSWSVSGGVHSTTDVLKATMAGADGVQMVSCLLLRGADHVTRLRVELEQWLQANDFEHLSQVRGAMNLSGNDAPHPFARAAYMRILQTWGG